MWGLVVSLTYGARRQVSTAIDDMTLYLSMFLQVQWEQTDRGSFTNLSTWWKHTASLFLSFKSFLYGFGQQQASLWKQHCIVSLS